jgi:L-fucose mutarotase/ribose pyranase (RbsD/FucU family)
MIPSTTAAPHWEEILVHRLTQFGHRNWIVIADSAYPAQSNSGIETIATGAGHLEVLGKTLKSIAVCKHLRAKVLVDAEFKSVAEVDAPGVTAVRESLYQLLDYQDARELDHEQIISMLAASGRQFRILILKSTLSIPYSSIFLELDCAYWNSAAEARLRIALKNASEVQVATQSTEQRLRSPRFSGPFSGAT